MTSGQRARDDDAVIAEPAELLDRFAALPSAAPLLRRLEGWPEDLYLVGGAVRDLMLGDQPADLDLMAPGSVDRLADRIGAAIVRHDRFGTASGDLDGHHYDFARARRETYPHPGALPEVSPADVEDDLARRDFTVNAIALGVLGPRRGKLMAFAGALEDVRAARLRVLHEASFVDDPTRLLRLSRYRARLGFSVEPRTLELAEAAIVSGALGSVSGDRIGTELRLLAKEADPVGALASLRSLGLDTAIEPGFGLSDPDLVRDALALLPDDGDPATLVLGTAVAGLHPGTRGALLNRLAFSARDRDRILDAAAAPELARRLGRSQAPSEIAATVGSAGPEAVALAGASGAREPAQRWLDGLRHVGLEISGSDLISAGIAPGPAIGRGLAAALGARLDDQAPDRETQLAVALRAAAGD
jgi:tRNA nucleotidyltransferase (CCA-adding enzyme)